MITDRELTFSNNQQVLANGNSTDVVDTGVAGVNINTNRELQVVALVTTAFAGGTNVTVDLVESASADLSSSTVLATSGAVAVADLTAGRELLRTSVPRTSKRYLGMKYTVTGTGQSAGNIFAGIVMDTHDTVIPTAELGL